MVTKIPVYFHPDQLKFAPKYEWALGNRIKHPESTKRAQTIYKTLAKESYFDIRTPKEIPQEAINDVHDFQLWSLYNAAAQLPDEEAFYPSVFLQRSQIRPDPTNLKHAGHYCFDSGTPLNNQTLTAASWSAACALEATELICSGENKVAYALSRPPGHHASQDQYGGYCYFNNAAISAKKLKTLGKVVIVDIDFHHGNGTQEIFYQDPDVFVMSLHGDPRNYFPYFLGYPSETGKNEGLGYNLNVIVPTGSTFDIYEKILTQQILPTIKAYQPQGLIISAGFDTYKLDPIGDFQLDTPDYEKMGQLFKALDLPTVILQEGGYYTKDLGKNVLSFLKGFT